MSPRVENDWRNLGKRTLGGLLFFTGVVVCLFGLCLPNLDGGESTGFALVLGSIPLISGYMLRSESIAPRIPTWDWAVQLTVLLIIIALMLASILTNR